MKIIIIGCGKVGYTIADELCHEDHDITIIDQNCSTVQAITNELDVMGVTGNGAIFQVQNEAGIRDADVMIATTGSDELNILCCLISKKIGNCYTIARIRNPEYSLEVNMIREELNLSLAINPELVAAREIFRLLQFPCALRIDTFAKGRVDLMTFNVPSSSMLTTMRIADVIQKIKCNVLICTVERGDGVIIPNGNFLLQPNDKASIVAAPSEATKFFKAVGIKNDSARSIMIAGGERITYYLARMLHDTSIRIKIIDSDQNNCLKLSEDLPNAMIIHGDASDQQLLLEEGIKQTDVFASLTGFDEENIILSLYAGRESDAKLITKLDRISFEDVVDSMNLGSVIYPKLLTADMILQHIRALQNSVGSNVETLYKIAGNKAEAVEFKVGQSFSALGIPLEDISLKPDILVACINRRGRIIFPRGKDTMEAGDTVIVITTTTGLHDLKDILA